MLRMLEPIRIKYDNAHEVYNGEIQLGNEKIGTLTVFNNQGQMIFYSASKQMRDFENEKGKIIVITE